MYYIILLICILSRLISTIYYPEDIDSLRFALSILDSYDISIFQPHLPGYPVFCFIAFIFYSITGSIAVSFSLIGGISTFVIIYISIKVLRYKFHSNSFFVVSILIILNPMIWILGNRYMPDLMGLAIAISGFYYIICSDSRKGKCMGFFLAGLLLGVRLSYFPILLIPIIINIRLRGDTIYYLASIVAGLSIWLFPFIVTQGLETVLDTGYRHATGHFSDYGGTILTEGDILLRIKSFLHTVWSDGLGGFWIDRSWVTILTSLMILLPLRNIHFARSLFLDSRVRVLLISAILYIGWIFFFQNIIYKSRHVLPIVYLVLIAIGYLIQFEKRYTIYWLLSIPLIFLTSNLVIDHRDGTSIHYVKDYLQIRPPDIIISNKLVNFYLQSNRLDSEYISAESIDSSFRYDILYGKDVKIIGNYKDIIDQDVEIYLDTVFFHNPYMNRMWPAIPIYSVK